MKGYKNLIFDVDHTLLDYSADEKGAFIRLFSALGVATDENMLKDCQEQSVKAWGEAGLFDVQSKKTQREYHLLYRSHLRVLFSRVFEKYGVNADVGAVSEQFLKELEHIGAPLFGAKTVLEKLKPTHRIFLATNGLSSIQRGRTAVFDGLFDGLFISEEIGAIKPQTAFFKHILHTIGAKKEECLMIGDSLVSDVAGANATGIDCCLFNPVHAPNQTKISPTYEIASLEELL